MMDDDFQDTFRSERNPCWAPISSYEATNGAPYLIVLMNHDDELGDDDHWLRGELLTVIAIIKTRLAHSSFTNHCIVPVYTTK